MTNYAEQAYVLEEKNTTFEQAVFYGCLVISMLTACYMLAMITTGNTWDIFMKVNRPFTDFTLALIECVLGIIALHIPMMIKKKTDLKIPDMLSAFYYVFILCGTVLGEAFSLYHAIPVWDSLLHFSSGIMAGMLGGIMMVHFSQKKKCEAIISPMLIAVCAICFALCIGTVWEIYEFTVDSILNLNMQRYMMQNGTTLVGQAALVDTMKDFILDFAGAIVAAVSAYASLKTRKGWLYEYTKKQDAEEYQKVSIEREAVTYTS